MYPLQRIIKNTDKKTCDIYIAYVDEQMICQRCGKSYSRANRSRHYKSYKCKSSLLLSCDSIPFGRKCNIYIYQRWLRHIRRNKRTTNNIRKKPKEKTERSELFKTRRKELGKIGIMCELFCRIEYGPIKKTSWN